MGLAAWAGMAGTCFLSALLLGSNGFGFALLAVPGLLLFAPPGEAVELTVIVTLAVLAVVLPGLRREVNAPLLTRFVIGSMVGLPLGFVAFRYANPIAARAAIGIVVLAFAAALALSRVHRRQAVLAMRPGRDLAAGAVSGAATTLVGMAGPPVLIYLMLADTPARTMRATLLAFFAVCYTGTLVVNLIAIGIPGATWLVAAALTPFALIGGLLGRRLGDRLGETAAAVLAVAVLAAAGIYAVASAAQLALS